MKTPAEWASDLGIKILDPDGWRYDGKSFDEPLDEDEFMLRMGRSTISGIGHLVKHEDLAGYYSQPVEITEDDYEPRPVPMAPAPCDTDEFHPDPYTPHFVYQGSLFRVLEGEESGGVWVFTCEWIDDDPEG